ncbi:MAG: hypothetical protein K8L91_18655 [Anaerolineae bacterium]|nr:hypothetical protein [Anaerolineae bacterium]
MRRTMITISLLCLLILSACGEDKEDKSNNDGDSETPGSATSTATDETASGSTSDLATFTASQTITLADGTSATYAITLAHPPEWTTEAGEVTHFIRNRQPMTLPMESGDIEISLSVRAFVPPDLTMLEQVMPGASLTPITLADYEGLRVDFMDEIATHSEGSTILVQLDDTAFLFITVQMAFGERATLESAALEILESLVVTKAN